MKPCKACPWIRASEPGYLGGSEAEVYVGQAVLPFWLPCHSSANYEGKASDVNAVVECAGAAMFRANIGVKLPPSLLSMPADQEVAFGSLAEFYAHHKGIPVAVAEKILTDAKIRELAEKELNDANVRMQLKRKK